jgi:hypothetical protein
MSPLNDGLYRCVTPEPADYLSAICLFKSVQHSGTVGTTRSNRVAIDTP